MSRDQFGEQEEKSEILPPSCFRSWSNCTFCCLEAAFRIPLEPLFKGRWFLVKGSKLFPQLDQAVRLSVWQGICLIPRGDQAVGQSLHFGKALDTGPRHSCKWPTVVLSVTFMNSCFTSHIKWGFKVRLWLIKLNHKTAVEKDLAKSGLASRSNSVGTTSTASGRAEGLQDPLVSGQALIFSL